RSGNARVDCEFDGENPTGWKIRCEACFRIGGVDPSVWIDTAVVNFTGVAALWLEWSQAHVRSHNWDQFVAAVLEKFGHTGFQQLLRKFSKLKQSGSVLEYAEQFNVAMHSLLAHHGSWDPLFFTTHFIDGLHSEIKVAVMLHRPKDLDTAVALAKLQEEAVEMVRQEQESQVTARGLTSTARAGRFSARPPL
uniref:Retrotransposon gag domain-containing protein n=1 Tax=Triticum urartu TaxID=4572 RepID=A0A8R7UD17_TRIUA